VEAAGTITNGRRKLGGVAVAGTGGIAWRLVGVVGGGEDGAVARSGDSRPWLDTCWPHGGVARVTGVTMTRYLKKLFQQPKQSVRPCLDPLSF
jgi:hypothetical protein